MKTKFFSVAVLLIMTYFSVPAQSGAILRGGLNLANVSVTDNGRVNDAKMLTSFQAGIIGDIHVASILYFQPGLLFTGKGTKSQSGTEGSANWYKATTNPYYLEIPATFVLKSPTGPVRFFGGAGPYLGIGIAGKNKADPTSFIAAVFECVDIINRRNEYDERNRNPLRKITAEVLKNVEDEKIDDTMMQLSSELMSQRDAAYGYLKTGAKNNAGLKTAVDKIGQAFTSQGKRKTKKAA